MFIVIKFYYWNLKHNLIVNRLQLSLLNGGFGSYKKDQGLIFLHTDWANEVHKAFIIWLFLLLLIYPMPTSTEIIGNIQQFSEIFRSSLKSFFKVILQVLKIFWKPTSRKLVQIRIFTDCASTNQKSGNCKVI